MWADCKRIVLTLTACERNSVHEAFKINNCIILVLNRSVLNIDNSCILLLNLLNLCLEIFISNLCAYLGNLNALICSESNLRTYRNCCSKDEVLAFLDLCYINLRLWYDIKTALNCCSMILLRNDRISCILIKNAGAIHLLDHLLRYLTLTETRNTYLILILLISSFHSLSEFFCINLYGQLNHVLF